MSASSEMTLSLFESRFKNRQYIGSGGFAKVYKAFDHAKNHYVALKVADVRPDYKQFTLQREVELVNKLSPHPNIARYDACYRFDMGVAGEIDFAILKFYEDGNLEQFIKKRELTPEDTRIIIKGILRGVSFLHNNNYVHRDLKSQNILIQRDDGVWTPKITDFGLSRSMGTDSTANNSAIGMSYAYAAPEQIQNRKINKNVDIWAVGVIIYRVIAGELPFKSKKENDDPTAQSQMELSRKIVNGILPEKLNTLPEPYQTIIKRCLITDPKTRCSNAEELISLLDGEKPFVGNYEEEEEQGKSSFQPPRPTIFVPVEPEREEEEEDKTRVLQPIAPIAPPVRKVAEPTPVVPSPSYPTEADYSTPKSDYTQVIKPIKKEPPSPPVVEGKPPLLSGEPSKMRAWLWSAVIISLLLACLAAYLFINKQEPSTITGIEGKVKIIPTLEKLQELNEEAKGNPEQLEEVRENLEISIGIYPNDYHRFYELAKNQVYSNNEEKAFGALKSAASVAIANGETTSLMADLNRDKAGIFYDFPQGDDTKWGLLVEAVQKKDGTILSKI